MSKRSQITMTEAEIVEFIEHRRTVVLATVKTDGRPHLVPMWFVHEGPVIEVWSFAKAQKTLNLRRDPRATLLLETGREYGELRGVSLECEAEVLENLEEVERIGLALGRRYKSASSLEPVTSEEREAFRAHIAKRIGFRFYPTRKISWDHRKLGGAY